MGADALSARSKPLMATFVFVSLGTTVPGYRMPRSDVSATQTFYWQARISTLSGDQNVRCLSEDCFSCNLSMLTGPRIGLPGNTRTHAVFATALRGPAKKECFIDTLRRVFLANAARSSRQRTSELRAPCMPAHSERFLGRAVAKTRQFGLNRWQEALSALRHPAARPIE